MDNLIVVKLNNHKPPVFKEDKRKDWIIFGTEPPYVNNYPKYLIDLYDGSSIHSAIINAKVHYICGNGLEIDYTGLNTEQKSLLNDKLKRANKYGETIDDVIKKCVLDKQLFNAFYLEIKFNKAKTDFEFYHMPYNSLREDKEGDGYWYSDDWSQSNQTEEKTGLRFIPRADFEETQDGIMPFKVYKVDCKYYTKPDYQAACAAIEADKEISNYNLQGIKSQFNVGTIISFNNGTPTDEEKQAIEKKLKEKFTSTDAANSLLTMFNKTKDNAPTIERLQSPDFADQYKELLIQVRDTIINAHRFPPLLAGIQTEGKLGNSTEYNDALETLKVSQIVPEQRLIERFFNDVLKEKGFEDRVRLKEAQKVQAQWSENTLFQVMTKNEIRESIGLEPIEEAKPMVSNVAHRFTDVKTLIGCFAARAKKRDEFEIIESRPYEFALNKEIYRNILAIIKENPLMDNESIAKALKRPLKDVQETISYLEKEGYIDSKKITSQGLDGNTGKQSERSISKKADEILKAKPPKFDNYEIMYSYEWRPDVRDRDVTNSRDFCVELLNLDAFYSREDIESISQEVGWDVFRHRGGFWNDDGKIRPYCRHIWVQNVVKKKNG